jgi:hypothetical protein
MAPVTAAMAITVVNADTIIINRARPTSCCVSASAPEGGKLARGLPYMLLMMSPRKSLLIAADEAGERLDRVLARHVAELSRSRLKALIEAGAVAVDGRTIRDPSHRVNSGAAVVVDVPPPEPAKPVPEPIPLKVVYEDGDIIVIDKPKNLVVHPAAGNWTGTLVNALIAHCGDSLSGIGGERRPGIVHRLDKDTTGLMVVAKNDHAHRGLAAQFADLGCTGPAPRGHRRADRPQSRGPRPYGDPPGWA